MSGRSPSRAARLVAWGNAFLRGWVSLDEAAERIVAGDACHRVDGLPGGDDVSVAVALGRSAQAGARGWRLALPVPGDVSTLPGPEAFNTAALTAGEAALCDGVPWGLVPGVDDRQKVRWRLHQTSGRTPATPGLSDASRGLAAAVREATEALVALDVAGSGPHAERGIAQIRDAGSGPRALPPAYPVSARELLDRATRLAAILELANSEEGAAQSASAIAARRAELVQLAAATRAAIIASYNAPMESAAGRLDRPGAPAG